MGDEYHLSVSIPDSGAKLFELKGARAGVGRGVDNQIPVDFESISGTHCEFRRVKEGYALVDLGSTNGTRVNGKKAPPNKALPLEDGDRILLSEQVAIYFYRVREGQAPPDASATESTDAASLRTARTLADLGTRIAAMKEQEAELAAGIAAMKAEFEKRQKEVVKVEAGMKQLEADLEAKRAGASGSKADKEEIFAMEEELLGVTRKWKLMASDLEGQKAQLESLGEAVAAPVAASGPLKVAPLAPAAPLTGSAQSTQKLVDATATPAVAAKGTLARIVDTTTDSAAPLASAEPAAPAVPAKKAAQAVKAAVPAKVAQAVKAAVPAKVAQAVKAAVPAKAAQAVKAAVPAKAAQAVKAAVPASQAQAVKAAVPAEAVQAAVPAQAEGEVKAAVPVKAAQATGPAKLAKAAPATAGQSQPTVALKRAAGGVPVLKKAPAKKAANLQPPEQSAGS